MLYVTWEFGLFGFGRLISVRPFDWIGTLCLTENMNLIYLAKKKKKMIKMQKDEENERKKRRHNFLVIDVKMYFDNRILIVIV